MTITSVARGPERAKESDVAIVLDRVCGKNKKTVPRTCKAPSLLLLRLANPFQPDRPSLPPFFIPLPAIETPLCITLQGIDLDA
jgi:hypothetical protein